MKVNNHFRAGVVAYIVIGATFLCAVSVMGSSTVTETTTDVHVVSVSESIMSAL